MNDDLLYGVVLLGAFRVARGGDDVALQEGQQRLVAYLALTADHGATRPTLISALWPDATVPHARGALRSTLWRLRRAVPGLVRSNGQRVSLDPSATIDLQALQLVTRRALDAPRDLGGDELATLTGAAELLADWDDDWITVERERIHEVRLQALERLAEDLTERGQVSRAIEAGLAAVADEPYRESAHRVLIEAYVRKGNAVAAIERFHLLRRRLRRELGVVPSPDLTATIRRLQRDRSSRRPSDPE